MPNPGPLTGAAGDWDRLVAPRMSLAGYVPTRKAAQLDTLKALREE
jgi:hypothetical protein